MVPKNASSNKLKAPIPKLLNTSRTAGHLVVVRAILDLGVSMTSLKMVGDRWKGHKQLVHRNFSEQRQEYIERIRTIMVRAQRAKADILVLPACIFPYHSNADLRLFRQEAKRIPWVVGGLLKIEIVKGQPIYSETWEAWYRGRRRASHDNETVGWMKMGKVSAMVAISSTIGMISYGWYKKSRRDPPDEALDLLALDLGHHQYSGRYLKTLRRVFNSIKLMTHRRGLVILSFWKYKNSNSRVRWSNPDFYRGMRFTRHCVNQNIVQHGDWLDVFRLKQE
jgi:hypothetical protein